MQTHRKLAPARWLSPSVRAASSPNQTFRMSRAAVMEPMQFKYKRADDCNKWTQSTCQESPSKRPMKSQFSLPATRSIESPTNLRLAHAENLKRPLMLRAPGRAPVPLLLLLALALPQSLSSAPSRSQSCDQAKFVASTGFNTTLTVPLGGEAHFRCTVQDKGNCNIAWFHNTRRHHIAIDDQVVTSRRGRVKASHSFNTTFNLYINKVELEDEVSVRVGWAFNSRLLHEANRGRV